ncbi:MAG: acyl-CoA/acyl-ACP dehydrogenase [Gammaproteobacteria bacterium]|nr:acyl-CoA/acyl-ACP dehydrogenase [Gammaproteobacteria bacterium]
MNFGFTEEQNLLRDQVARFMQEACSMGKVRELMASDDGFDAALWRQAGELGWLGLTLPEEHGGIGLGWIDLTVVLEETGRGLSPLPIASQALSAAAILRCGNDRHKADWLPAMASGEAICTLSLYDDANWIDPGAITLTGVAADGGLQISGSKPFVADAMAANYYLLAVQGPAGLCLAAVSRDQVEVAPQQHIDPTKPMGRVTLNDVVVGDDFILPLKPDDLAYLTDVGAVAITAEMVGAAEAALNMTNEYAKDRIQFGKPIGQYQGVKHRLADIYVDIESFKSLLYYAAWTVDEAPNELARAASLAKGYASDAFAQIGIDGIGLHGAIGFTAEYDIQLYLKRSKWARPMYGDSDYHLDRVATLGGL